MRLLIIAAAAGAVLLGWVLLQRPSTEWEISAGAPLVVGSPLDPFSYDGTHVLPAEGELALTVDAATASGRLQVRLRATGPAPLRSLVGELEGAEILIQATELEGRWIDLPVYGDSGRGGPELPETEALIAGTGRFTVSLDGSPTAATFAGRFSVAAAVRREDGSIGQGGLIYSPLLRDKTGFAAADRLEATLVLTAPDARGQETVVWHIVFTRVTIDARPAGTGSD